MRIYVWELLAVCHHPEKSCENEHCDSEDKIFLIFHVTSREHMFKWLCEVIGGSTHGESSPSHVW